MWHMQEYCTVYQNYHKQLHLDLGDPGARKDNSYAKPHKICFHILQNIHPVSSIMGQDQTQRVQVPSEILHFNQTGESRGFILLLLLGETCKRCRILNCNSLAWLHTDIFFVWSHITSHLSSSMLTPSSLCHTCATSYIFNPSVWLMILQKRVFFSWTQEKQLLH